ncbi:putative bifunctional diguanylate cyclase/phosphodiesterase [Pandoraea oxalativorans]|uniref:Diguanylate phosphodiesterase n=1 Tax=Pandoraea oxalativorans TaxID=573737 RepID=A0A0E3YCG0_9BURK|nr:EAL domain-containing protein [Pandoraea oxalativorans]AKC70690.1 diguanylate phosphodiesterase [Pandoraea oxalativorans]
MSSSYSGWLVALSLAVAVLASFTALDLSGRIYLLTHRGMRQAWLAVGATAMGIGIWSMHFIGMLALSLSPSWSPLDSKATLALGYDPAITAASLGIAIAISWAALWLVASERFTRWRLGCAGVTLGIGIAAMHYSGMAAMKMDPAISYDPLLFAASIAIAIAAATAALWIARTLRDGSLRYVMAKRMGAAVVMGLAITAMHYTGMSAATFAAGAVCGAANGVSSPWLVTTVSLFTFLILITTMLVSRLDARTSFLANSVLQLNTQIARMATYDALTDLPNRRALHDAAARMLINSRRDQRRFAVLFMDLDGFKTINDSLGHNVGDDVLRAFAKRLRKNVNGDDVVARLGGDEFVVLLGSLSSPEVAGRVAQRLLDDMRDGLKVGTQSLHVMPSIGVALFPDDGDSIDLLLKHADTAMYEAKRAGRGIFRYFEPRMNAAAQRTWEIQQALHDAESAQYFSLNFQPKYRGDTEALAGAEALLRLTHPTFGELQPADFIPVAERTGQIVQIGYWVVRATCKHIKEWDAAGLPPVKVAINLSPRQMAQSQLVENIVQIVQDAGIACTRLMFEITETVAMFDAQHTIDVIRAFQDHGFEVAIDDFGTGYSSLAYLQRFRVKQLKMDRFFTNGLDTCGREGSAVVSAIIALAHSLDMDVVAEGVETASQREALKTLDCDELQGFLLGKPLTGDAFARLLASLPGIPGTPVMA